MPSKFLSPKDKEKSAHTANSGHKHFIKQYLEIDSKYRCFTSSSILRSHIQDVKWFWDTTRFIWQVNKFITSNQMVAGNIFFPYGCSK